ncbi:hypothetical protein PEC18_17585 [Paucibacter sp. O1-1]|nr:hypothetical protein [Paucibacter sp. O1-1]MDA3827611.1 hypothetical protein [Paucibacter sp. O1-1]
MMRLMRTPLAQTLPPWQEEGIVIGNRAALAAQRRRIAVGQRQRAVRRQAAQRGRQQHGREAVAGAHRVGQPGHGHAGALGQQASLGIEGRIAGRAPGQDQAPQAEALHQAAYRVAQRCGRPQRVRGRPGRRAKPAQQAIQLLVVDLEPIGPGQRERGQLGRVGAAAQVQVQID